MNSVSATVVGDSISVDLKHLVRIVNYPSGYIVGKGGDGGDANTGVRGESNPGTNGGHAIKASANVELFVENYGIIGGGGGGAGGGNGGIGAGLNKNETGGKGGAPGQPGGDGGNWKNSFLEFKNQTLIITFNEKFIPRRGRINCSLNDAGKWRWFGIQFSIEQN